MKTEQEKRHEHVETAIKKFTEYMRTYPEQSGYTSYSDKTIVRDIVYGVGLALWGNQEADGYFATAAKFRELM